MREYQKYENFPGFEIQKIISVQVSNKSVQGGIFSEIK